MSASLTQIGKIYRFNTLSPAILGASIINAKLISIVGYERAMLLDPENIDVRHRAIYPSLPAGTPDRVRDYVFYEFKTQSGKTIVLADVWIDMATVEIVTHVNFVIEVTDASMDDMVNVGRLLGTTGLKFTMRET